MTGATAQLRVAGGYDKLIIGDILALLNEALEGVGAADNKPDILWAVAPPANAAYRSHNEGTIS